MCIGIPMQVVESGFGYAMCDAGGEIRRIDTMLVGDQPPGTWLLTFIDTAREVLSESQAAMIRDALKAVGAVLQGETDVDRYFTDLV